MNKSQTRKAITKHFLNTLNTHYGIDNVVVSDDGEGGRLWIDVMGGNGNDGGYSIEYSRSNPNNFVVIQDGDVDNNELDVLVKEFIDVAIWDVGMEVLESLGNNKM